MQRTAAGITYERQIASHVAAVAVMLAVMALLALSSGAARAQEIIKAHGISTFGTLKYPADFEHLDYVNPEAPKGGEMSIWAFGGFDSMHPYTTKGRAGALSTIFFESLLEGTADEIGASYGLLAESLEYPEDRSWVIFNIRPEARFSDGTPLTAEDVVFSYELFRDKGLPSFRAVLRTQVESAEVLGPHRVKFTFTPGIPTRDLPETVGGLPIFSKAHYLANNRDFEESSLEPLLGSGPYVLDRMEVGQTIVYRKDPDWWGADLPINRGRYNFETIRIEYYADYNAAFEGFKGGSYTFRNEASSKIWATGYDFPAVQKGWVVKRELPDGTIAPGQAWAINMRRPHLQDVRVREALGLMFNFEWSNEKLFYGLYERIHSFWENTELAASGVPAPEEVAILKPLVDEGLLPPSILTEEAVMAPVSSASRQLDRGNLRKASALLDEAGWTVGSDGMRRNAAGELLTVEFLNDSQTFDRVINPYVENLRRLGVNAVHQRVDNAEATNRERNYDFDLVTTQFRMSYIPGAGLKQYFGSETADSSVFNLMGLKDPAVDRLIDLVIAAETQEELLHRVHALDRVLRSIRFWVPQWFKDVHTVAYYDMYEHPDPLPPYALGNLDFWWYNAEKAEKLKAAGAF
ncbi:microcin C transport system substrate-binding protein [Meinhardsimonia xiamenensis]|jgi:microcin C transport system substrate-binding protein|uniref:Microcin C transport system substrate-binding protein n=2 Tax=Meinhardsimonia xiamenensis TaxID=990712 RepID=A0A1G9CFN2_9RHOB|nr:microcin C transport system substrate-binding protein [Meinhardsimonia xiamenensis]SDK50458.1 microcin C transport system substrate-binding protein [Meinhardsimonia xiamenensis]